MKNDFEGKMATLIARCWMDAEFRNRFIAEPKAVIAEAVLGLAPDAELVILEESRQKRYLVLPEAPPEGFSMADLQTAAQQMFHTSPVPSGPGGTPSAPPATPYCDADPYCFRELSQRTGPDLLAAIPYCDADIAEPYCRDVEMAEPYCRDVDAAAPYCDPVTEAPYCDSDPSHGSKP